MAKQKQQPELQSEEGAPKLLPSAFIPADDPGKADTERLSLKFGEVLISALDENGNEGIPFKVNQSTYQRYYGNTEKFIVKKTF